MFPWFWLWAPQVHLPWSGNVAQRIEPDTHWFFQGIQPQAGHAAIEEEAFSMATYGKQLGLISELLLDLTQQVQPHTAKGQEAHAKLQSIAQRIEAIKQNEYVNALASIELQIQALQAQAAQNKAKLKVETKRLPKPN